MKSSMNWQDYQTLKQTSAQAKHDRSQLTAGSKLYSFWQMMLSRLEYSTEPRVWQTQDQNGQQSWSAYDPNTNRSISQLSEAEMRVWLEERHYGFGLPANLSF